MTTKEEEESKETIRNPCTQRFRDSNKNEQLLM